MKAANLDSSPRLKRLFRALSDGKKHSTLNLHRRAHVMAISAAVAELRDNGFDITCQRKGDIWYYQLSI